MAQVQPACRTVIGEYPFYFRPLSFRHRVAKVLPQILILCALKYKTRWNVPPGPVQPPNKYSPHSMCLPSGMPQKLHPLLSGRDAFRFKFGPQPAKCFQLLLEIRLGPLLRGFLSLYEPHAFLQF